MNSIPFLPTRGYFNLAQIPTPLHFCHPPSAQPTPPHNAIHPPHHHTAATEATPAPHTQHPPSHPYVETLIDPHTNTYRLLVPVSAWGEGEDGHYISELTGWESAHWRREGDVWVVTGEVPADYCWLLEGCAEARRGVRMAFANVCEARERAERAAARAAQAALSCVTGMWASWGQGGRDEYVGFCVS